MTDSRPETRRRSQAGKRLEQGAEGESPRFYVRVGATTRDNYRARAEQLGLTLSDWVRMACERAYKDDSIPPAEGND